MLDVLTSLTARPGNRGVFAWRRRVPMPELTAPETGRKRGDDHSGPPIATVRVAVDNALPSQQGIAGR